MQARTWRWTRSAIAAMVALLGGVAAQQPAAAMTPFTGGQDVVVAYSDDGEWIGHGRQHVWRGSETRIQLGGSPNHVFVEVVGTDPEINLRQIEFYLGAPEGEELTTGVYAGAQRLSFGADDRPQMEISSTGRGCNTIDGTFEIRDIARNPQGEVTRLWAIYEQFCERRDKALWGEIRIGMPAPADGPLLVPSVVRWPAVDLGTPRTEVPVTLIAGDAAVDVRDAVVDGDQASDFGLRTIPWAPCVGGTVPAGGSCRLRVAFEPPAPGLRQARLDVTDTEGTTYATQLQGWSFGGSTGLRFSGEPGEWLTAGSEHVVRAADAGFHIRADRSGVSAGLRTTSPVPRFALGFGVPWSEDLVVGKAYTDARLPFPGWTGRTIFVERGSYVCRDQTGAFVVDRARWNPDGTLGGIALRFEQRCEDGAPVARGVLRWRDGDTATPAPWMTSSSTVTAVPAPAAAEPAPAAEELPDPMLPANWVTPPTAPPTEPDGPGTGDGTGTATSGDPGGRSDDADRSPSPAPPAQELARPPAAPRASAAPRPAFRGLRAGGRVLRFTVRVPGSGSLTVAPTVRLRDASGRTRTVRLGAARVAAKRAGIRTVSVRIPAAAVRSLRAHRGRVPMTTQVRWKATGGKPLTSRTKHVLRRR